MKYIWMFCLLAISSSTLTLEQETLSENEEQEEAIERDLDEPERAHHHCHNPACPHYSKEDDEQKLNAQQLQQLAVATAANIAQLIFAIGSDPHNPPNVANNVTNIIGHFANFVAQAMNDKSININELLADEKFLAACKQILVNNIEVIKKEKKQNKK